MLKFLKRLIFIASLYIIAAVICAPLLVAYLSSLLRAIFSGNLDSDNSSLHAATGLLSLIMMPLGAFFPRSDGPIAIPILPFWAFLTNSFFWGFAGAMLVEVIPALRDGQLKKPSSNFDSFISAKSESIFGRNTESSGAKMRGLFQLTAICLAHFLLSMALILLVSAHEMNTGRYEGASWLALQIMLFPLVPLFRQIAEIVNSAIFQIPQIIFFNSLLFSLLFLALKRAIQELLAKE